MRSWVCNFYRNIWFLSSFVFLRSSCHTKPVDRSSLFNATILHCGRNYYVPLLRYPKSLPHNRIFPTNPQWPRGFSRHIYSNHGFSFPPRRSSLLLLYEQQFFRFSRLWYSRHSCARTPSNIRSVPFFDFPRRPALWSVRDYWSYHCHVVLYFSCVSRALVVLQ